MPVETNSCFLLLHWQVSQCCILLLSCGLGCIYNVLINPGTYQKWQSRVGTTTTETNHIHCRCFFFFIGRVNVKQRYLENFSYTGNNLFDSLPRTGSSVHSISIGCRGTSNTCTLGTHLPLPHRMYRHTTPHKDTLTLWYVLWHWHTPLPTHNSCWNWLQTLISAFIDTMMLWNANSSVPCPPIHTYTPPTRKEVSVHGISISYRLWSCFQYRKYTHTHTVWHTDTSTHWVWTLTCTHTHTHTLHTHTHHTTHIHTLSLFMLGYASLCL